MQTSGPDYDRAVAGTKKFFEALNVHDLPKIFSYWAVTHLRPIWEEFGFASSEQFFAKYLLESARRCTATRPRFASIGAGACSVELGAVKLLRASGLSGFSIECIELSSDLLAMGRQAAAEAGLDEFMTFTQADVNRWAPGRTYQGIMVHHALHHVVRLEDLYGQVARSLAPKAFFVAADMIGRNGHQRWPEALEHVQRFWRELPPSYRYNRLLKRHEELYENFDASAVAFEGIRAQEVLPLLVERFDFRLFVAYANVIDIFVDRCFGHNFDPEAAWDREFIDRVHNFDESAIRSGQLTPTQMLAVMTNGPADEHLYSRGLSPESCIRRHDRANNPRSGHEKRRASEARATLAATDHRREG